jgi:hypothetical protein
MAQTTVTAQVHEALDVHRHFPAQVTLYRELRDLGTNVFYFGFRQITDPGFRLYASRCANLQ